MIYNRVAKQNGFSTFSDVNQYKDECFTYVSKVDRGGRSPPQAGGRKAPSNLQEAKSVRSQEVCRKHKNSPGSEIRTSSKSTQTHSHNIFLFVFILTMMPSPRLHQSLELNNEGARLICKGEYARAVSTFLEAMTTVKQMVADENSIAENRDEDTEMDSTCEYCSEIVSCMEAESSSSPEEAASCEDESSHCFVFRNPLVMSLDANECGDRTVAKLSAIMMFNMALSHHLSALKHHKNATQLHAALMLYENAYLLLENEQVEICVLYNLALSNNLGQVLKSMKHQPEARQCFEQLLSILLLLVEYCDDEEKVCLEGFFRSASPCILGNAKAASAA